MSEFAPPEKALPRREVDRVRAEAFETYVGPFSGDVYSTALNCFPGFKFLRAMSVRFDPTTNIFRGGIIEATGEPNIYIGTQPGAVNNRIKSRVIERFGLPDEVRDMPEGVLLPIIFAHELGHVIQRDPLFEQFYGTLERGFPDPDVNYAGYVHSDVEANADFIAAEILSNTVYGAAVGIMPPTEGPAEWRQWADAHQLPRTIQAFPDQPPSA